MASLAALKAHPRKSLARSRRRSLSRGEPQQDPPGRAIHGIDSCGQQLDPDRTTRKPRRLRYPNMLAGNNCTRAFAAGKSKRAGEGRKQLG